MELRHLRYFVAAAEEEHFGRAAERVHVTRPAVSQIIASLEEELGVQLFERGGHRVRLTPAGRALLPRLRSVMNDLSDALEMAKQVGRGKRGTLNIGHGSLALRHPVFRGAIKQYCEDFPDVALRLLEIPSPMQPLALAEGKIHGAFMVLGPRSAVFRKDSANDVLERDGIVLESIQIQSGGLGVVVPHSHRLAQKSSVSLAELAAEDFIVVPRSSSSPGYGPLSALCQQAGFEPHIVQEVQTITTLQNLVSMGMGVGLAALQKHFSYPSTVALIPVEDVDYTTTFVFSWVQEKRDLVLEQMIDIIRNLAAQDTWPAPDDATMATV